MQAWISSTGLRAATGFAGAVVTILGLFSSCSNGEDNKPLVNIDADCSIQTVFLGFGNKVICHKGTE